MKFYGVIAGLAAASIWGGMYVVSKVMLEIIPPFMLLSIRLFLGVVSLGLVIRLRGGFRADRHQTLNAFLVGVLGFGISLGFQFTGTDLSTAANASLVTAAAPLFMILFAALILKERASRTRVLAMILSTAGVLAVVDLPQVIKGGVASLGNLLLLAAAMTWGLYSVLVKRVSIQLNTLEVSLIAFLGGLALGLPLSVIEASSSSVGEITPLVILGLVYLGVVSTALAMYLWNRSLALLEAGIVSLLFFAQPVVGGGLGAWLLNEELTAGYWVGALLIGAGLFLGTSEKSSAVVETTG